MTLFEQFRKWKIDHAVIGLEQRDGGSDYFCTPKGAKLIGWAGVDGIHYCFLKDFGEMVFAVSPMNLPGEHVHPLAENFEDFLRLLLTCGEPSALEQAFQWDEARFDAFLKENPPTDQQREILAVIKEKLSIEPMEQPFSYLKNLQSSFDYGRIPYKKEYFEIVPAEPTIPEAPPWKVCFGDGFCPRKGRSSTEIPIGKQFQWDGYNTVHIPAVYPCGKGLTVDVCVEVEPERIRSYLSGVSDPKAHPLNVDFRPTVTVNGRTLTDYSGSGDCWLPVEFQEEGTIGNLEAMWTAEHYGFDLTRGWSLHRFHFSWEKKPNIKTLSLTLEQNPRAIKGMTFSDPEPGQEFVFEHPLTGQTHTLTIHETERKTVDLSRHSADHMLEFPPHYLTMTYTVAPEIPQNRFQLRDCARSDPPRQRPLENASCIGIIGGVDGPTAVFLSTKEIAALSSLYFKPVEHVQWRMIFREKLVEDITVTLL